MLDPAEITDLVFKTAGSPIRSSSLYYSLYYLDEILDVDNAAFDLSRIEDELYDGFFWYGIHAVTNEMTKMESRFVVEGRIFSKLSEDEKDRYLRSLVGGDIKQVKAAIETPTSGIRSLVRKEFEFLNEDTDILDSPRGYLEKLKSLFDIEPEAGQTIIDNMEIKNETGWSSGFGGKSWAKICDFLLDRDKELKRIWVDKSWSIQHNTGTWLNKVVLSQRERERIANRASDDELFRVGALTEMRVEKAEVQSKNRGIAYSEALAKNLQGRFIQKNLLNEILDHNFNENMDEVFRYGSWYNDEVGPDLNRLRRRLA